MSYEIGDFIQLIKVKRKWNVPADAKFQIEAINEKDRTILTAIYKGELYGVFAENIKRVISKREVVTFT